MSSQRTPFAKGVTKKDLTSAYGKTVPDLIAPGLRVLFSGINPSLYSAAVQHHFARPGNRFYGALYRAGFTPRLFAPDEDQKLLKLGLGITNVVSRATASAAELTAEDYRQGSRALARKLHRYQPYIVAFVGISAYRMVAADPRAIIGEQAKPFAGARTWVLPNPSGLNAHYQLDELAQIYGELARAIETERSIFQSRQRARRMTTPKRLQ